jgi:hypothetical protein
MPRRTRILLALASVFSSLHAEDFDGLHEAVGVNLTADQGFGARQSGMAITFPAFQRDADAVVNSPAGMNDVDDLTFSTAHAERFGEAKFDDFAFLFPFEANSTFGLGLSRYGISDIDLRPQGSDPLRAEPEGHFSIADYLIAGSFARRWGGFDAGVDLNVLYRHQDQDGLGIRGDAQAQYTWNERFRVGALLKGLIPSSARWESGYAEYEATELYFGGAALIPAPYFYGTLQAAWQSEGVFHETAKSAAELNGKAIYQDPLKFLATGNLGLEFLFDFGLSARFGLNEISKKSFTDVLAFGVGYNWRHILGLDYSFTPHPGLLSTHQISLQFTPAFSRFDGRYYRPDSRKKIRTPAPSDSHPESEQGSLESLESENASQTEPSTPVQTQPASMPTQIPAPAPAVPAPAMENPKTESPVATPPVQPASPVVQPAEPTPAQPVAPAAQPSSAAPAKPADPAKASAPAATPPVEQEILENDDE